VPAKRRKSKRRVAELPDVCWRHLCDLAEPGDESRQEMIDFEFSDIPMEIEAAWALFGEEATAEHARVLPGCRPQLWWKHSARERERRKVSGSGEPTGSFLVYGLSFYEGVNPADPAMAESEATYLERHGLFLPGERRRLTEEDFEPEPALTMREWLHGDDGDDDEPPPGAARPARRAA
jgi:hypothetical protein